jgi:hypothetical protein
MTFSDEIAGTTHSAAAGSSPLALATALVAKASAQHVDVRVLGGVAIALRCASARPLGPLSRTYSDLDFVARRKHAKGVVKAFSSLGYQSDHRFNAIHAGSRMRFEGLGGGHADVFLEEFRMCHTLRLSSRLAVDAPTLPLADLLLTKLQVGNLNAKDVTDIAALLVDHDLTSDDSGINVKYLVGLLATDWGWWRTATETLERTRSLANQLPLDANALERVRAAVDELRTRIDGEPKRARWRARARLGDRRPWREEPEDGGA